MKLHSAITAGMFAALLGCAGAHAQAPASARIGTDVDAALLDPRIMRDTTAYRVDDLLFDGLVQLDAKSRTQAGSGDELGPSRRHHLDLPSARREVPGRLAGDCR